MQVPRSDTIAPYSPPLAPPTRRLPDGLTLALPTGLALCLGVSVLVLDQGSGALLAGLAYLGAAALVCIGLRRHYPHTRFGACNTVTLMRVAMTAALLAPLIGGQAAGWTVAIVATISLSLDGVDGFLARRSGLSSAFGARFDMEADAALALVLALHALSGSPVGAEVLVLGVMRYVFIGAGLVVPRLQAPLEPRFWRKAVCVLQLATLIALQIPQLPVDVAIILARFASLALIWSFGSDILRLWRQR